MNLRNLEIKDAPYMLEWMHDENVLVGLQREKFINKTIDVIAKESGKSRTYIIFDMIINFITRGCGYTDYFRGNYVSAYKRHPRRQRQAPTRDC